MFNKITLIVLGVMFFNTNLFSQITFKSTNLYKAGFTNETDIEKSNWIYNKSGRKDTIVWNRTTNTLPDTKWTSAVCDIIQCHSTETNTNSFEMEAGDSGYLSFHFYPDGVRGAGSMVVEFYRVSTPSVKTEINYNVNVWGAASIDVNTFRTDYLYPNPSNQFFTIKNSLIQTGTLEIINAQGQVVLTQDYDANQAIDLSAFESGFYTVKVFNAEQVAQYKLIKN